MPTSHIVLRAPEYSSDELKQSMGVTTALIDGNETDVNKGIGSGRMFCYDENGDQQDTILSDVYSLCSGSGSLFNKRAPKIR